MVQTGNAKSIALGSDVKVWIAVLALLTIVVIDVSLVKVYDLISKRFIDIETKELLYVSESALAVIFQYLLLRYIRPLELSKKREKTHHIKLIYRMTRLVQYALWALLVVVIGQLLLYSKYSTWVITTIIILSYLLCITILLVYIFRSTHGIYFRSSSKVALLFVIALGTLALNAVTAMVDVYLRLGDRPEEIVVFFGGSGDLSLGKYDLLDEFYFATYVFSYFAAWIATISLLNYYSKRLGKVKFWLLAVCPLLFFLMQFAPILSQNIGAVSGDPFFQSSLVRITVALSKPVAGVMLALAFWTMGRVRGGNPTVRRSLILSGFGFLLLFTCNQALLLAVAPYPPFGISTITLFGLAGFLATSGIFISSISLAHDLELRKSIRRLARSQSELLDSMVAAEVENEIEERVYQVVQAQSRDMENESGIPASLDEYDMKEYLEKVMKELKNK